MTIEQVINNAANPKTLNTVCRKLTEKQAQQIIDRRREIVREVRRISRSVARRKKHEIEECWDMWNNYEA